MEKQYILDRAFFVQRLGGMIQGSPLNHTPSKGGNTAAGSKLAQILKEKVLFPFHCPATLQLIHPLLHWRNQGNPTFLSKQWCIESAFSHCAVWKERSTAHGSCCQAGRNLPKGLMQSTGCNLETPELDKTKQLQLKKKNT